MSHAFLSIGDIMAELRLNLVPVLKGLPRRVFSGFCDSSFVLCTKNTVHLDLFGNPWLFIWIIGIST